MQNSIKFERTILPYLGRTAKLAGFYFIDTFHENGIELSKEQWIVLRRLHDEDGIIQNNLAFITNRSKTSLTRLIQTMEKKGLIFRTSSKKDKRINHVHLSELGKEIFLFSLPVLKKLTEDLQKNISLEDLDTTIQVLNKIQNNINKKIKLY